MFYESECFAYMYICASHTVWCSQRQEERIRPPGTGGKDDSEPPRDSNTGPLEEYPVLLTSEPSFLLPIFAFNDFKKDLVQYIGMS